jgi:hypothetical protein
MAMMLSVIVGTGAWGIGEDPAALRGAGITRDALPVELQSIDVRQSFIPSDRKKAGTVQNMIGNVVVVHGEGTAAYFAAPGDTIYEGDELYTVGASRCRFKSVNDDLVTIGDDGHLTVDKIILDREQKKKDSVFSLLRGKVMFYAMKLFKYRSATMTVKTRTAVAGIRGTKFGVEVIPDAGGGPQAKAPVYLADASETGWVRLAQAPGTTSNVGGYTVVYSFDGTVTVTSTVTGQSVTLSTGEFVNMFATGAGEVQPTPEGLSLLFQNSTSAPDGEGEGEGDDGDGEGAGGEGGDEGDDEGDGGTDGTDGMGVTDGTAATDVTQQQSTTETERSAASDPVSDPGTNASGANTGYFAAMLSNVTGGSLEEIFVSTTRQNFDGENVWARGTKDTSTDYIRGSGGINITQPYARWAVFGSGRKNTGDLGSNHPISDHELGRIGELLEWGYFTVPAAFEVDGVYYAIDNKAYWISGQNTPSMSGFTGSSSYSGSAYGTSYSPSGGINMTGSFSSNVNFGTGTISDFYLDVSGGGDSASISSAAGSIAGDGTYRITGGSWYHNNVVPDHQYCYGSFYGSNDEAMGGAWGMYSSSTNTGAVGIFQGERGDPMNQYGYFTGMLRVEYGVGSRSWQTTFISEDMQTAGFQSATADDVSSPSDYVKIENGAVTRWSMKGYDSADVVWEESPGKTITTNQQGNTSYMEWGNWTQPDVMTAYNYEGNENYYFDTQGYYVWGDKTVDMPQTGSYVYSGDAYGTILDGSTAADMTGSFDTNVDFGTNQLSQFNLSVTDGSSYSASISGASGTITNSNFDVSGGTWTLGPTGYTSTAGSKSAYGSFYGPNAEAMGGVWQMDDGESCRAVGSFVSGTREQ